MTSVNASTLLAIENRCDHLVKLVHELRVKVDKAGAPFRRHIGDIAELEQRLAVLAKDVVEQCKRCWSERGGEPTL